MLLLSGRGGQCPWRTALEAPLCWSSGASCVPPLLDGAPHGVCSPSTPAEHLFSLPGECLQHPPLFASSLLAAPQSRGNQRTHTLPIASLPACPFPLVLSGPFLRRDGPCSCDRPHLISHCSPSLPRTLSQFSPLPASGHAARTAISTTFSGPTCPPASISAPLPVTNPLQAVLVLYFLPRRHISPTLRRPPACHHCCRTPRCLGFSCPTCCTSSYSSDSSFSACLPAPPFPWLLHLVPPGWPCNLPPMDSIPMGHAQAHTLTHQLSALSPSSLSDTLTVMTWTSPGCLFWGYLKFTTLTPNYLLPWTPQTSRKKDRGRVEREERRKEKVSSCCSDERSLG